MESRHDVIDHEPHDEYAVQAEESRCKIIKCLEPLVVIVDLQTQERNASHDQDVDEQDDADDTRSDVDIVRSVVLINANHVHE